MAEVAAPRGRGREAAETGWVKAEPSVLRAPPVVFVSFESTELRLELPASCRAEVEAPAGSGREAAETGCVVAVPSTLSTPPAVTERPRKLVPSVPPTRVAEPGVADPVVPTEAFTTEMLPVTGTGAWSEAMTTGVDAAETAEPSAGVLVLMDERLEFPAVWRTEVAAPVGSVMLPVTFVMFHAPDWETGRADWSVAMVTGKEDDMTV